MPGTLVCQHLKGMVLRQPIFIGGGSTPQSLLPMPKIQHALLMHESAECGE